MRATPIQNTPGFSLKKQQKYPKTTAYYLFNEECRHTYSIDYAHFKARNGRLGEPVVSSSAADMERIANSMITTEGTIIDIVDAFVDGARLSFPNPRTPYDIYKRILDHLDFHLNEMRTNITYQPPPVDDLRNMSEFATLIRPFAQDVEPNLDQAIPGLDMQSRLPVRPTFTIHDLVTKKQEPQVPKTVKKMDAIERYLDSIGYFE